MKVIVYEYTGSYGSGLVFLSPEKERNWISKNYSYKRLGVFDLPLDFLNAISKGNFDGCNISQHYIE